MCPTSLALESLSASHSRNAQCDQMHDFVGEGAITYLSFWIQLLRLGIISFSVPLSLARPPPRTGGGRLAVDTDCSWIPPDPPRLQMGQES